MFALLEKKEDLLVETVEGGEKIYSLLVDKEGKPFRTTDPSGIKLASCLHETHNKSWWSILGESIKITLLKPIQETVACKHITHDAFVRKIKILCDEKIRSIKEKQELQKTQRLYEERLRAAEATIAELQAEVKRLLALQPEGEKVNIADPEKVMIEMSEKFAADLTKIAAAQLEGFRKQTATSSSYLSGRIGLGFGLGLSSGQPQQVHRTNDSLADDLDGVIDSDDEDKKKKSGMDMKAK